MQCISVFLLTILYECVSADEPSSDDGTVQPVSPSMIWLGLAVVICCFAIIFIYKMCIQNDGKRWGKVSQDPLGALGLASKFDYQSLQKQMESESPSRATVMAGAKIKEAYGGRMDLISNENCAEMVIEKEIGHGSFGVVFRGSWKGIKVAVKKIDVLNADTDEIDEMLDDFRTEVTVMCKLKHRNIVNFMGCTTIPEITIIQELMGDSVHEVLKSREELSVEDIHNWALDTAEGIQYLHNHVPQVLHRDLKSPNLMLNVDRSICKITDFGLSVALRTGESAANTQCGTPYWTAPEILCGETYDSKVDVYSFAMVLIEFWTRKIPFKGQHPAEVAVKVVNQDKRPPIPKYVPAILNTLIQDCWAPYAQDRPNFDEIIKRLEQFEVDHKVLLNGSVTLDDLMHG